MFNKIKEFVTKHRTIIAIVLLMIIVISVLIIVFVPEKKTEKTNKTVTLIGNVLKTTDDTVTIKNVDGEYLIKTDKTNYEVGTTLEVKGTKNKKTIKAKKIKVIIEPTAIDVEEIDTNNQIANEPSIDANTSSSNNQSSESNNENQNSTYVEENSEEVVVAYLQDIDNNLTPTTYQSASEKVKSGFISTIDFIFYGGTIKGKTFKELSTSAKLKVLKLATSIDNKIDSYFPGYKESISKTSSKVYTSLKSKIVAKYLDITTEICNYDSNICTQAKEDFQTMKSSYGLTWSMLKDLAGTGVTKLKAWYAIWKAS